MNIKSNKTILYFVTLVFSLILSQNGLTAQNNMNTEPYTKYDTATFGTGCFWCSEAIFSRVNGVISTTVGYSGGAEPDPDYKLVCSGRTNYAEVTQVVYDPAVVPFRELLKIFWNTHDPTTLNQQGADVGKQYRSVIFYHNDEQKKEAEYYKDQLTKEKIWDKPIVTEISPFISFYKAEDYHQDYYENNPHAGYCNFVITPKVEKFEKVFKDQLKKQP
jgi:peptide-methionine (S)-S-oxide reductase